MMTSNDEEGVTVMKMSMVKMTMRMRMVKMMLMLMVILLRTAVNQISVTRQYRGLPCS